MKRGIFPIAAILLALLLAGCGNGNTSYTAQEMWEDAVKQNDISGEPGDVEQGVLHDMLVESFGDSLYDAYVMHMKVPLFYVWLQTSDAGNTGELLGQIETFLTENDIRQSGNCNFNFEFFTKEEKGASQTFINYGSVVVASQNGELFATFYASSEDDVAAKAVADAFAQNETLSKIAIPNDEMDVLLQEYLAN